MYETVTTVALTTGSNGKKGCTSKCKGCYLGVYSSQKPMYQGNIKQIYELVDLLPNLNLVIIMGNPDPSVDTTFCNDTARYLQSRGIEVIFNTSGFGGLATTKKLLQELDPKMVRHMDYSVDSLDSNISKQLKGVEIPLSGIVEALEYCNSLGIPTRIKPTIWPVNKGEDWLAFKKFFIGHNVSKISFHFGSIEGVNANIMHVGEKDMIKIRNEIMHYKIGTIPYLLLNDCEYQEYIDNFTPYCQRATRPLIVYLESDGIKVTSSCQVSSCMSPSDHIFDINKKNISPLDKKDACPIAYKSLGYESKTLHHVCRFYKYKPV